MFVVTDSTGRQYVRRVIRSRVVWCHHRQHAATFNRVEADRVAARLGGSVETAQRAFHA